LKSDGDFFKVVRSSFKEEASRCDLLTENQIANATKSAVKPLCPERLLRTRSLQTGARLSGLGLLTLLQRFLPLLFVPESALAAFCGNLPTGYKTSEMLIDRHRNCPASLPALNHFQYSTRKFETVVIVVINGTVHLVARPILPLL
jgi:hypothetical protein